VTGGTANVQTLAAQNTITAYAALQSFSVRAGVTNDGAMTLNVDDLGALAVEKYNNTGARVALAAGDWQLGQTHRVIYDGTRFVVVSPINDIATQAEAEVGTDNTKLMTPLRTAEAIAQFLAASGYQSRTPTYESAELPHVGAARITANHGLGRVPHSWRVVKRITAASAGYLVGDEIDLTTQVDGDGARGYVSWVNATTLNFYADTTHIQNTAADIAGATGSIVFYAW
jgi:hypothetical protein